jgi:phospholipid transport system substrate-binding protein
MGCRQAQFLELTPAVKDDQPIMDMTKNHSKIVDMITVLGLSAILLMIPARGGATTNPLDVVKSGTNRALEILKSVHAGTSPPLVQRKAEILTIVDEYFNFEEMAKRAVGPSWKAQPPDVQSEFVSLFKNLLFDTYISRVNTYTDIEGKVEFTAEQIQGDYALVKTRFVGHKEKDVEVDYRLRLHDQRWKVYDIIIVGISLVNNYRSQFSAIMVNNSFAAVLEKLRQKAPAP